MNEVKDIVCKPSPFLALYAEVNKLSIYLKAIKVYQL